MFREQRFRYEMFIRVRDFGIDHADRFPESSPGGQMFARVATFVTVIDRHFQNRILARIEGGAVKPATRTMVYRYMKMLAKAGRRVTRDEQVVNPFRMSRVRTLKVELDTARTFIQNAETRQAKFVAMGLPPTFISDFTSLVDDFHRLVEVRLNSKTARSQAQAGIASAFAEGLEVIRDLEVIVDMAAYTDPVLAAAWQAARHIDGQRSRASRKATPAAITPTDTPSATPAALAADPALVKAS